jgi:hypothetical protein
VLTALNTQLTLTKQAADNSRQQATHFESIAESRYDSLGLEQAYLAHGLSVRAMECLADIQQIKLILTSLFEKPLNTASCSKQNVHMGSIITLQKTKNLSRIAIYCQLLPIKGGAIIKHNDLDIQLISDRSPLGSSLLGKYADDIVTINAFDYKILDIV